MFSAMRTGLRKCGLPFRITIKNNDYFRHSSIVGRNKFSFLSYVIQDVNKIQSHLCGMWFHYDKLLLTRVKFRMSVVPAFPLSLTLQCTKY